MSSTVEIVVNLIENKVWIRHHQSWNTQREPQLIMKFNWMLKDSIILTANLIFSQTSKKGMLLTSNSLSQETFTKRCCQKDHINLTMRRQVKGKSLWWEGLRLAQLTWKSRPCKTRLVQGIQSLSWITSTHNSLPSIHQLIATGW